MRNRIVPILIAASVVILIPLFLLLGPVLSQMIVGPLTGRSYYIPSASMRPTLETGDRISPRLADPATLHRGAVIVIAVASGARVERVVGLPGDTVQMRGGRVVLNGTEVLQTADGTVPTELARTATRMIEQFPGEATAHRVLDAGTTFADDTALVKVPPGHLFLLGDNRDNSADSRYPAEMGGIGPVPFESVRGRVDFIAWSMRRWRIGRPIDDYGPDRIFTWL